MEVTAEKLRKVCDSEILDFETTENVNAKNGIIGQRKAFEALRVGVGVADKDFQIYVAGASDTGKTRLVKRFLEKIKQDNREILDWFYAFNFENPDQPRYLSVSAGQGKELKDDLTDLISDLRKEIPTFFSSKEWQEKVSQATAVFDELKKAIIGALYEKAKTFECVFKEMPDGMIMLFLADPDDPDSPISKEVLDDLSIEEKNRLKAKYMEAVQALMPEHQRTVKEIKKILKEAER
ncbi:MAG: AAA family ATPase, partial [bacterium]|nr:AAA family ATPase [bacterium]